MERKIRAPKLSATGREHNQIRKVTFEQKKTREREKR